MTPPSNSNAAGFAEVANRPNPYRASPAGTQARTSPSLLKQVRQLHLYLGTFFAPAILFFSLTGAAQVFSFHETQRGSSYQPPVWLEKLAQVHKKQTLEIRPKAPPKAATNAAPSQPRPDATRPVQDRANPDRSRIGTLLLKWFFFVMSLGLLFTTLLGLYLAFKYNRDRRVIWGLLLVGTAMPLVLALL